LTSRPCQGCPIARDGPAGIAGGAAAGDGVGVVGAGSDTGPVGIVETDRARDATEVHAVDRWCYLGAARCEPDLAHALEDRPRFDYDHYRILSRYLARPGARVVPLDACTASS
jgi:hypothetical protein